MERGLQRRESDDLSDEEIHDVLRNRRRRLVIDILQQAGSDLTVRELSERIGTIESGEDPPPRNVKQSVYVSLLQTHLPKLDDLEIIDYESEGKLVRMDSALNEIAIFLETVQPYGISRSEYYTALSLLGLLTVFGSQMGVIGLSAISTITWTYGYLGVVFLSGVYHTYRQGITVFHRVFK